jgi:hypothetical protein
MEKDGPLDGRKYNENNKASQMGQVTPKKNGPNRNGTIKCRALEKVVIIAIVLKTVRQESI